MGLYVHQGPRWMEVRDDASDYPVNSFRDEDAFKAVIRAGLDYFNRKGEPIDHETEPAPTDAKKWEDMGLWQHVVRVESVLKTALAIIGRDGEKYGTSLLTLRDMLRNPEEKAA